MEPLVAFARAFADPTRVRILMALRAAELCVCELCDALEVTQSTLSTHLQVIRAAELVSTRREGRWSYYALAPGGRRLVAALSRHFSRSLTVDRTLRADAVRLRRRLALRERGACCIGFGCGGVPRQTSTRRTTRKARP